MSDNILQALYEAAVADGGMTPVSILAERFNVTDMYFIIQVSNYARDRDERIPMINFPRRDRVRGPVVWEHGKPVLAILNEDTSEENYRRGYCHGYQKALGDFEMFHDRRIPVAVAMEWMLRFLVERLTQNWRMHKEKKFPLVPPDLASDLGT